MKSKNQESKQNKQQQTTYRLFLVFKNKKGHITISAFHLLRLHTWSNLREELILRKLTVKPAFILHPSPGTIK